ncbi:MAG: NYN domain-containing protein [Myxococcales bacterium]|nr:NYN domain-containing protein [Myxococcales bacterium]
MSVEDQLLNIAVFCDFENIALGARDANYDAFDIQLVLERLLDKGKIVVKKAYADWDRYKSHKRAMHEASFELIEIPHVSYSGKNSADIRLVVDALDLCYTKTHVDTFAVLSGDSDFSPLVSKLRENNKMVIGVGVKNSSSDLLIENCDEFIYYDDLVRKKQQVAKSKGKGSRRDGGKEPRESKEPKDKEAKDKEAKKEPPRDSDEIGNKDEAIELVLDTCEALFQEREGNLWGSLVKQTLKRKRPNFDETFYGYRSFSQLILECKNRGFLETKRDDKSGDQLILGFGSEA